MKKILQNKKILIALAVVVAVAAIGGTLLYRNSRKGDLGTETAVARSQDSEDPNLHHIDDEAIALAGDADATGLMNQAVATLALVNTQRAAVGLGGLVWDENLVQAAYVRAIEASQVFSHTRPNGQDWWTVNSAIMYGENLAHNFYSPESVVNAWKNSPTHRANIVGGFRTMGVAIYQASNGQWYWAQEFGY